MLPRGHILWGAILTVVFYFIFPEIGAVGLTLIFLSSFLIDFDHYVNSVLNTGKISLSESFWYHERLAKVEEYENKRGIRRKGDFHLFHTLEFHILIGLLGFFWVGFFYIFVGMVFHSLLDVYSLIRDDKFYRREFFFFNWLRRKF